MEAIVAPVIYDVRLENNSFQKLQDAYSNIIHSTATLGEIEKSMIEYANTVIEPIGWKGIWRATKGSHGLIMDEDFLVEVLDVSMDSLQSRIKVTSVIIGEGDHVNTALNEYDCLRTEILVPLIELFPISEGDEEENFLKTAIAIQYIRFFYENIWRPWDEDDDENYSFVEKYLNTRLKFFFDAKNKIIPESMGTRADEILREGWEIRAKLESFQSSSDSESDLLEEDVASVINLRLRLEDLQREMEILETPLFRDLVHKDSTATQLIRNYPVTHMVGSKITLEMIDNASSDLDEKTVVQIHSSPAKAIASAKNGDTVLVYAGHYRCSSLGWIENDITIRGCGEANSVVLEASTGCGDIFLNSQCNLKLSNLTFKAEKKMKAALVVHSGKIAMTSCVVYGAAHCLLVLSTATAEIKKCEFLNSNDDCIQLRYRATLSLESLNVRQCQGSGLKIEGPVEMAQGVSVVFLSNVSFQSNGGHGILLVVDEDDNSAEETIDFQYLANLWWLKLENQNTTFTLNTKSSFGVEWRPSLPTKHEDFEESISRRIQSLSNDCESEVACASDCGGYLSLLEDESFSLSSEQDCFQENSDVCLNKTLTGCLDFSP